jgi:hypothetical protein
VSAPVFGQTKSPAEIRRERRAAELAENAARVDRITVEWRKWAQAVTADCATMEKPCPDCGLHLAEPETSCGFCFICHGRDNCGCDAKVQP